MPDKFQEKQQCPHCEEFVMFNEIQTRTYKYTIEGKKKVSVAILRCPECKRITGPSKPLDQQRA